MPSVFRDAFTAAFYFHRREIVWTANPNPKTTAIFSYVAPAIGRYMDLALARELPADASFYSRRDVVGIKQEYPDKTKAIILVEHENRPTYSGNEMRLLAGWSGKLNVLITYQPGCISNQIQWARTTFSPILGPLGSSDREFLLVLPGQQDDPSVNHQAGSRLTPKAGWWNFLRWDASTTQFKRLP